MKSSFLVNRKARFQESLLFLQGALRRYKEVGMLLPCSDAVAARVSQRVPLEKMRLVVEVGSGTGRITRALLPRMAADTRLICVEKNTEFCHYLRQAVPAPNVTVLNLAVEDLLVQDDIPLKSGHVDCLILSLPAAMVSHDTRVHWAKICEQLVGRNGFVVIHQFIPVMNRYFTSAGWHRYSRAWYLDFPPFRVDVLQRKN